MNESDDKLNNAIKALKKRGEDSPIPDNLISQTKKRFSCYPAKHANFRMQGRFLRFSAAACLIVGVYLLIGPFNSSQTAWADIQERVVNIKSLQFYEFNYRNSIIESSRRGWYEDDVVYYKNSNSNIETDNGIDRIKYNSAGIVLSTDRSQWGDLSRVEHENIFNKIIKGILKYKDEDIKNKVPSDIGKDFLLYRFDAASEVSEDIKMVSIFVGKRSQLPVQMKVFYKDDTERFDMFIFEYDTDGLPDELKDITSHSGKNAQSLNSL